MKALTRRLAEGWDDEYDTLRPVADLRFELQLQVYLMLQRPLRWEGGEPDDDAKQQRIDDVSNAVTRSSSPGRGGRALAGGLTRS